MCLVQCQGNLYPAPSESHDRGLLVGYEVNRVLAWRKLSGLELITCSDLNKVIGNNYCGNFTSARESVEYITLGYLPFFSISYTHDLNVMDKGA